MQQSTLESLDDATLASLGRQIKQSHELLKTIDTKMDKVIGMLDAQFKMLSSLLIGVDAPKLICFLPVGAVDDSDEKSWWRKMLRTSPKTCSTARCWCSLWIP